MHHAGHRHLIAPRSVIHKAGTDGMAQVEALASKLEGKLGVAILEALLKQQATVSIDAIIAALEHGDIAGVLAQLNLPESLAAFDAIPGVLHTGVSAAGTATATSLVTQLRGVSFVFNSLNPRLITWLQTYSLGLIRQINESTRQGVRQYLIDGMKAGDNPKVVAQQVKGIIGLTDKQSKAVLNYRKQLETFHNKRSASSFGLGNKVNRVNSTQVAILDESGDNTDGINERRLRDFRYDGQLKRAMESSTPLKPAQIDKMVAAYERKYLAFRSRTIARTEAIRANNVGVQDAWHQAIEKGVVQEDLVRKRWIVARDERTCEVCSPIPRMNPKLGVKHGQMFKTPDGPVSLPPIHPQCRCTVFYRAYEPVQLEDEQ